MLTLRKCFRKSKVMGWRPKDSNTLFGDQLCTSQALDVRCHRGTMCWLRAGSTVFTSCRSALHAVRKYATEVNFCFALWVPSLRVVKLMKWITMYWIRTWIRTLKGPLVHYWSFSQRNRVSPVRSKTLEWIICTVCCCIYKPTAVNWYTSLHVLSMGCGPTKLTILTLTGDTSKNV